MKKQCRSLAQWVHNEKLVLMCVCKAPSSTVLSLAISPTLLLQCTRDGHLLITHLAVTQDEVASDDAGRTWAAINTIILCAQWVRCEECEFSK